jgi:hypothetical protein
MLKAALSSSYSSSLPSIFVSRGRNNVQPRPIPNVVVYISNISYPENLNTRVFSGSAVTVQQIGNCELNIEVEQYAKDTPEDDLLSTYVFGAFNLPKQNMEDASSGLIFIYSSGKPEQSETLNIEDNTWIQKLSIPILATLTT